MLFWYGVEQFFLNEISDGVFARAVSTIVFMLVYSILNIPTGALSDIWGRLRSLKLGIVLQAIGMIILGTSTNLWQYAIGGIVFTAFWALDEGAKEAFLYDSMVDAKQQKHFQKYLGRQNAFLLIGAAFANMLSGFIADAFGLRSVFFVSLIASVSAFICLLHLREPHHHKQVGKKFFSQLSGLVRLLRSSVILRSLVMVSILVFLAAVVSQEFAQLHILEFFETPVGLGLSWMIVALVMASASWYSHLIPSLRHTIFGSIGLIVLFWFGRKSIYGLIPYIALIGIIEAALLQIEAALQDNTPSKFRASVSSISATTTGFIIVPLALWLGSNNEVAIAGPVIYVTLPLLLLSMYLINKSHYKAKN